MNAVAYLRVSGKSQVEGDGFPRQKEAVEKEAAKQGFEITHVFREEGVSGTIEGDDRPAFKKMVSFVLDNPSAKTIFVENLTRLARAVGVQENILTYLALKNIDLISADTGENITQAIKADPMKKALIQMQATFAELEKSNLVNKLRKARERKKAETGRCGGQHPFGTLNEDEKVTVETMKRLRAQGCTTRDIAEYLNNAGRPTRNGRSWNYSVVAKILARLTSADEPEFA